MSVDRCVCVLTVFLIAILTVCECKASEEGIEKESIAESKWLGRYPNVEGRRYARTQFDQDLDCKIKELAFNYSKELLLPSANYGSIFDALRLGEVCGLSRDDVLSWEHPKALNFKKKSTSADLSKAAVYVDDRRGDDKAFGSRFSPLQTVEAGLSACRSQIKKQPSSKRQCTVYLRHGHYFLQDTIKITPADSGIQIAGYEGEQAVLSGGKVLKTHWQNYDRHWTLYEGLAPVFEDINPAESTAQVKYHGKVLKDTDCLDACASDKSCSSFAYYDESVQKFASMCYFRVDGLWNPVAKQGALGGKLKNIYVADLSGQGVKSFTSLFIKDKRLVRARFPNGDPETTGDYTVPNGYVDTAKSWGAPQKFGAPTELHLDQPSRAESLFSNFQIGIDGTVSAFHPPKSYWGTAHPQGGGGATYKVPTGLQYSSDLEIAKRKWDDSTTGIVHAFQSYYWGNWQFRIDSRNLSTNTFKWSFGGFQEARGSDHGGQWYVENIFEELDVANEWFLDEKTMKLYFFPNGTEELPDEVIAPQLETIISVIGTKRAPVTDVKIKGVTFQHSASTYMENYEVPSGGDWSVHRGATVFLEGTEDAVVDSCVFSAPGGNGIFISNYNVRATISNNELYKLGDNGIVLVGSSELIDGTDGNQPRKTQILQNIVRDNGIWGKQTYAAVQSLACETHFEGNVFFNGPRGGVNFNDGFGGGNSLERNLIFNFVRETKDHGPVNSWDRQPYVTRVRDGKNPSLMPKENMITKNFIINNYQSTWPIDHDDGSCYWTDSENLLVYGGFKNYLGHSKHVVNNFYIYPDMEPQPGSSFNDPFCAFTAGQSIGSSGYGDAWTNNMCVAGTPVVYGLGSCEDGKLEMLVPYFANNRFYTPDGNITINCGSNTWTLEQFQARGFDIGTITSGLPSTNEIISMGKKFLGI